MTLCSKSIPGRPDLNPPRQYARSGIVCTIPRREASRSASISEMNQVLMIETHVLQFVRTTIASNSMLYEGRHKDRLTIRHRGFACRECKRFVGSPHDCDSHGHHLSCTW